MAGSRLLRVFSLDRINCLQRSYSKSYNSHQLTRFQQLLVESSRSAMQGSQGLPTQAEWESLLQFVWPPHASVTSIIPILRKFEHAEGVSADSSIAAQLLHILHGTMQGSFGLQRSIVESFVAFVAFLHQRADFAPAVVAGLNWASLCAIPHFILKVSPANADIALARKCAIQVKECIWSDGLRENYGLISTTISACGKIEMRLLFAVLKSLVVPPNGGPANIEKATDILSQVVTMFFGTWRDLPVRAEQLAAPAAALNLSKEVILEKLKALFEHHRKRMFKYAARESLSGLLVNIIFGANKIPHGEETHIFEACLRILNPADLTDDLRDCLVAFATSSASISFLDVLQRTALASSDETFPKLFSLFHNVAFKGQEIALAFRELVSSDLVARASSFVGNAHLVLALFKDLMKSPNAKKWIDLLVRMTMKLAPHPVEVPEGILEAHAASLFAVSPTTQPLFLTMVANMVDAAVSSAVQLDSWISRFCSKSTETLSQFPLSLLKLIPDNDVLVSNVAKLAFCTLQAQLSSSYSSASQHLLDLALQAASTKPSAATAACYLVVLQYGGNLARNHLRTLLMKPEEGGADKLSAQLLSGLYLLGGAGLAHLLEAVYSISSQENDDAIIAAVARALETLTGRTLEHLLAALSDTMTPSPQATECLYQFLHTVSTSDFLTAFTRACIKARVVQVISLLKHPVADVRACAVYCGAVLYDLSPEAKQRFLERYTRQPPSLAPSLKRQMINHKAASPLLFLSKAKQNNWRKFDAKDCREAADKLALVSNGTSEERTLSPELPPEGYGFVKVDGQEFPRFQCPESLRHEIPPVNKLVLTKTARANLLSIMQAVGNPLPQLIGGDTGVGKTSLITEAAAILGMPLTRFNMSDKVTIPDFIGKVNISADSDGISFRYDQGPFTKAFVSGKWLILDELNLAPPHVLQAIETALDQKEIRYHA